MALFGLIAKCSDCGLITLRKNLNEDLRCERCADKALKLRRKELQEENQRLKETQRKQELERKRLQEQELERKRLQEQELEQKRTLESDPSLLLDQVTRKRISKSAMYNGEYLADILSRYVVVDIETTGFDFTNDRIIEIAAVIYEFGEKKESFHTLINPEMILPKKIISLTGITQTEVDAAPLLEDVSDSFLHFIQNLPIIGHNALTFDVPFLSARIKPINNPVVDTLIMARKAFPDLPRHKLDYLKTALELGESPSHRALSDVETTNELLWACLAPHRYESKVMHAYLDNVLQGTASSGTKPKKKRTPSAPINQRQYIDIKSIVPTVEPDPNSPLYGKCILFTGDLSIPRGQAMQMAVNAGAILKSSVSRKINYLVVGKHNPAWVDQSGRSKKEIAVEELNQSGKASIKVISENEFLSLTKKVEVTA